VLVLTMQDKANSNILVSQVVIIQALLMIKG
jgi:hypothetical protein